MVSQNPRQMKYLSDAALLVGLFVSASRSNSGAWIYTFNEGGPTGDQVVQISGAPRSWAFLNGYKKGIEKGIEKGRS